MTIITKENLLKALCEASEGSRELDEAVERFTNTKHFFGGAPIYGMPCYTTSLDAALTLVPRDADWDIGRYGGRSPQATVTVDSGDGSDVGTAPTPALALCIAAIKARP